MEEKAAPKQQKLNIPLLFLPVVWLVLIFVTLHFTSPLGVGPAGTLLLFGLFYAFLSGILFWILYAIGKLVVRFLKHGWFSRKTSYFLASVLALGPVFMMALNTLGQLGFIEVVLVFILLGIASFYVVRRSEG